MMHKIFTPQHKMGIGLGNYTCLFVNMNFIITKKAQKNVKDTN